MIFKVSWKLLTIWNNFKAILYSGIQPSNGKSEVQSLTLSSQNQGFFILNFDGANTCKILIKTFNRCI